VIPGGRPAFVLELSGWGQSRGYGRAVRCAPVASGRVTYAARFIVQLRFRPEETFYVRNPTEAVGGFRRSPFDHSLRIDNNQHSMLALMGIRDEILSR
jgi:hypothetical protein